MSPNQHVLGAVPPNVLLICVDDLEPTIGCFGDPHAVTPQIDRLASRGVAFRRSCVQQTVCAPSRNALMTGLRPDQIGVVLDAVDRLDLWKTASAVLVAELSARIAALGPARPPVAKDPTLVDAAGSR